MTISSILMRTERHARGAAGRRSFLVGLGAAGALALAGRPAAAFTVADARSLIDSVVRDVNGIIASGKAEAAMLRDFEALFVRYADVPAIARSALGPAARSASAAELQGFTRAFQGYIAR